MTKTPKATNEAVHTNTVGSRWPLARSWPTGELGPLVPSSDTSRCGSTVMSGTIRAIARLMRASGARRSKVSDSGNTTIRSTTVASGLTPPR